MEFKGTKGKWVVDIDESSYNEYQENTLVTILLLGYVPFFIHELIYKYEKIQYSLCRPSVGI